MRAVHLIIASLIAATALAGETDSLLKKPSDWFKSAQAREIGQNILTWQTPNGDWPKNTDTVTVPRSTNAAAVKGTFDNGATVGELRLLAKLYVANQDERFKDALLRASR